MLTLLSQLAFAADTAAGAVLDIVEEGRVRSVNAATHIGFDITGPHPGVSGRVDLGHRLSVDGLVYTGIPMANSLKWTGGVSLGLSLAPLQVQLGQKGSLDLRVGVGGRAQTRTGLSVSLGDLTWSSWVAGTLELSPDGRYTLYGGAVVDPLAAKETVTPTGGVRVRLD